ncbi:CFEM domain-containing protein [Hirsutella rhossiliensis]|uniref:CFEM domain-containing protein n=1 Tax=Hirsutella rhossiliensis TaxID=111463 RepID=A0A9P8N3T4_9HYPO|nr:CFEM domain-containing protein [Hirsutella rhossiliensis]KAH0966067.1 CFEM domain-containing protein [Hirsutella rhossiliensis]
MKNSFGALSLLALARFAAANPQCQSLTSAFPSCALSCVKSAASQVGCTNSEDLGCQCTPASSQAILATAQGCVIGCGIEQALPAIDAGSAICACLATATPSSASASPTSQTTPTNSSVPPEVTSKPPHHSDSSTPPQETSKEPSQPPKQTGSSLPSQTSEAPHSETTQAPIVSESSKESAKPVTSRPGETCDAASPCQKNADAVPQCAKACIEKAAVSAAKCDKADFACQCKAIDVIQNAAFDCVVSGCGITTGLEVIPAVSALCSCVSANPTTPCSSRPPPTGSSEPATTPKGTETSPASVTSAPGGTTEAPCVPGTASDCGAIATSAVPSCAQKCFSSYVPKIGCDVNNYACQCQPAAQESLTQLLVPCVATECPPEAIPSVIQGASQVCACATAPPSGGDCTASEGPGPILTKTETNVATVTSCEETETPEPSKPTDVPTRSPCEPGNGSDCGGHSKPTEPKPPVSEQPTASYSEVGPEPSCSDEQPTGLPSESPRVPCNGKPGCGGGEQLQPSESGRPTGGNPVAPQPRPIETQPGNPQPSCHGKPNCGGDHVVPQPPAVEKPTGGDSGKPVAPQPIETQPSSPQYPCQGKLNCAGDHVAPQPPAVEKPTGGDSGKPTVPQPIETQPSSPCHGKPNCGSEHVVPQPPAVEQPTGGDSGKPPPAVEKPAGGNSGKPVAPQPIETQPSSPCQGKPNCGGDEGAPKPSQGGSPTGAQPSGGETAPAVVVAGSAGRYEISLMACVFGAFWAMVVAL